MLRYLASSQSSRFHDRLILKEPHGLFVLITRSSMIPIISISRKRLDIIMYRK